MPRLEDEDIVRKHLWLFTDDWDWLNATFGSNVGVSKAVRTIIRKFRQQAEAKAAQIAKPVEPLNDELALSDGDLLAE